MCIVSFAWNCHPNWKLVAIGNRDEMHARPAEPLARWEQTNHMLAGRDQKAGGTWLGVSEQGRFAVVTNLAGFGDPDPKQASRGDLLKDFLSGDGQYSNVDETDFSSFNPFNLITVVQDSAAVHSNRPDSVSKILPVGVHGLSNGSLEQPWPKTYRLNAILEKWISGGANEPELLLDELRDETRYPLTETEEPRQTPEPRHSPIFIRSPIYGTRCSTVVAIDHKGAGTIIERRYAPSGNVTGNTRLSFSFPV